MTILQPAPSNEVDLLLLLRHRGDRNNKPAAEQPETFFALLKAQELSFNQ